jgi:hypothetical protein
MIIPELLFKVVLESKFPMLFKIVVIFETDSFYLSFKNFEIKIKRLFEIRLL